MVENKLGIVYGFFDDSGLRYIGQTTQSLSIRVKQHLWYSSKKKNHLGAWIRSLKKPFVVEIIEECPYSILDEREISWINEFKLLGCNLVNSMVGCVKSGHHLHSKESKAKIGKATTRIHTGMKRSKESRKRMSEAAKKRKNIPHSNMYTKEAKMKASIKTSKPVLQYTKEGEFIKEWMSATKAGIELSLSRGNIGSCCKGKVKTCGGYIWKYKNQN